jgi:hypothetical protein
MKEAGLKSKMDGGGRRKGVYDVLADSELKELSS